MIAFEELRFKDFITLQRGFDLPKKERTPGEYPIIGSTSVDGYHNEFKVRKPGVVTGRSGSLGEVLYVDKDFWPLNTTLWVRDFKGNDPRFVYYYLKTMDLARYNSGVGVPTLNRNHLDNVIVRIPERKYQGKISGVLSCFDVLIEANLNRIGILEEFAQSLYCEWFHSLRFPGHETIEIIQTSNGSLPKGWEIRRLSDLVETQYGYTESAKKEPVGPKFLRGMDINKTSYIDWSKVPYCTIDENDHWQFKLNKGDVLVIRMADPGKAGIVEEEVDAVFASYLIRLKIKSDEILPYYLYYFLSSEKYQGYIRGASTGTTRKSASAEVVTGTNIPIPPVEVVKQFENNVSAFRGLLNNFISKNSILRQMRDALLPKLVSGEIDVGNPYRTLGD